MNRVLPSESDCPCCSHTKVLRAELGVVSARLDVLKATAEGTRLFENRLTDMQMKLNEMQQTLQELQTDRDKTNDISQTSRLEPANAIRHDTHTKTSTGITQLPDRSTENITASADRQTQTDLYSTEHKSGDSLIENASSDSHSRHASAICNDQACSHRFEKEMTVIKQPKRKVFLNEDSWILLARHENDIASLITGEVKGVVTVLLIDISESMAVGEAWVQTRTFVKDYLKGLQDVRSQERSSNLEDEYVAIATFGHETRLQIYLTTDYDSATDFMDHVRLGGPSPLYGGLWLAMAGALSCEDGYHTINGILVVPKIIVISDYKPTETLLLTGPDIFRAEAIDESLTVILSALDSISKRNISVFFVAVGDSNQDFVNILRSIDKNVYTYTDGRRLSRQYFLSTRAGTFDIMSLMWDFRRRHDMSSDDQADMFTIRIESDRRMTERRERPDRRTMYCESTSTTLPKIGSRVRRGPDWPMTDDHDGNGPGTVVGHAEEVSKVWVGWDKNNLFCFPQKYGLHGLYEIVVTEEQRDLQPGEKIAVGCKVKPGRDGNFQGFHEWNTGIVIRVQPPKAHVRWDSGSRGDYSYGEDGKYEIEICTLTKGEASASGSPCLDASPSTDDATGVKPNQKNKNNK
ncbi:uncharacterized protein LOC127877083 isoform X2 [Dreissena polymorpha]|nr:uncharacterized protein LOC127877083 isoform X2 [Dreissena polymorpha]